jgi:hypothetical protein
MKNTTWSIPAMLSHTPAWASQVLAGLTTLFGAYQACIMQGLLVLSPEVEHKINGAYGIACMLLLGFGAKRKTDKDNGETTN